MTTELEKHIAEHPLFADLDPEYLSRLARHAVERDVAAGEYLSHPGAPARTFFLIRSGHVTVETPAIYGPTLELQSLGAGRLLGWSWLIPPYRWAFQARVDEDARVVEFDGEKILAESERDPAFGYQLFKRFTALMSERLEAARKRMIDAWNPSGFA